MARAEAKPCEKKLGKLLNSSQDSQSKGFKLVQKEGRKFELRSMNRSTWQVANWQMAKAAEKP